MEHSISCRCLGLNNPLLPIPNSARERKSGSGLPHHDSPPVLETGEVEAQGSGPEMRFVRFLLIKAMLDWMIRLFAEKNDPRQQNFSSLNGLPITH